MDALTTEPIQWPNRGDLGRRWLHSDMKDVAFLHNWRLFDFIAREGFLKPND